MAAYLLHNTTADLEKLRYVSSGIKIASADRGKIKAVYWLSLDNSTDMECRLNLSNLNTIHFPLILRKEEVLYTSYHLTED